MKCPKCSNEISSSEKKCSDCGTLVEDIQKRYQNPLDYVRYQYKFKNHISVGSNFSVKLEIMSLYKSYLQNPNKQKFIEVFDEFKYNQNEAIQHFVRFVKIVHSSNILDHVTYEEEFQGFVKRYTKEISVRAFLFGYERMEFLDLYRIDKEIIKTKDRLLEYDNQFSIVKDSLNTLNHDYPNIIEEQKQVESDLLDAIYKLSIIRQDAYELIFSAILIMRFFNIKNINELVNTSKINEYLFDHAHYTKIDFSYLVELIDTCESIFKSIVLFV